MQPTKEPIFAEELSDEARLWVLPLEGTPVALQNLWTQIQLFLQQWTSHGRAIECASQLVSHRFLLIAGEIPGGTVSGCGIDALMHAVEENSVKHNCRVLSSLLIYHRSAQGTIEFHPRGRFRGMIAEGLISGHTPVFNPGLHTLRALRAGEFELPLQDSVYARIFQLHSAIA